MWLAGQRRQGEASLLVVGCWSRKSTDVARIKTEVIIIMKERKQYPSKERLNELLRYEPDTGKLYWRVSRRAVKAGSLAGVQPTSEYGYRKVKIGGSEYKEHNIVWIMNGKQLPTSQIH